MIEVLHGEQNHKYLGKKLSGDLRKRAMVELQHRSQIAWMKFNEHGDTLLNRHVSLRLRLKLFGGAAGGGAGGAPPQNFQTRVRLDAGGSGQLWLVLAAESFVVSVWGLAVLELWLVVLVAFFPGTFRKGCGWILY